MRKTIDIVFDIIMQEFLREKNIKTGDVEINLSVSDIHTLFNSENKQRSKRSIELALNELKDLGFLDFSTSERVKTRCLILKNVLFYSKSVDSGFIFDGDKDFIRRLKNVGGKKFLHSLNFDLKDNRDLIFKKCFISLLNSIPDIIDNKNFTTGVRIPTDFVVLQISSKDTNIKDLKSFKNFPFSVKNCHFGGIEKISQNCEKNDTICEKTELLYILENMYNISTKKNNKHKYKYNNAIFSQIERKTSRFSRKPKMEEETFVGKIKTKKETTKPKIVSQNLFESGLKHVEYGDMTNKFERTKNFENTPLSAYKAKHWLDFISKKYKDIRGDKYSSAVPIDTQSLTGSVYPIVFEQFEFSALDFKEHLIELIEQKNNNGKFVKFVVGFVGSNEARLQEIQEFVSKRKKLREDDLFEDKIHIPHWPLTSDNDNLYAVLDRMPDKPLAIMYHYGIVVYHRYIQTRQDLSFNEATNKISKIFIKELFESKLVENRLDVAERLLAGIAKNTILWEPYPSNLEGENTYLPFLDWRKAFHKMFSDKKFGTMNYHWWTNAQDDSVNVLPSVDAIFKRRNKLSNKMKESLL